MSRSVALLVLVSKDDLGEVGSDIDSLLADELDLSPALRHLLLDLDQALSGLPAGA